MDYFRKATKIHLGYEKFLHFWTKEKYRYLNTFKVNNYWYRYKAGGASGNFEGRKEIYQAIMFICNEWDEDWINEIKIDMEGFRLRNVNTPYKVVKTQKYRFPVHNKRECSRIAKELIEEFCEEKENRQMVEINTYLTNVNL